MRDPESSGSAMNVFRILNPDIDGDTDDLLERSLNKVDNALFNLLMTSDWQIYETNDKATQMLSSTSKLEWL
jgi:hypothetical protein